VGAVLLLSVVESDLTDPREEVRLLGFVEPEELLVYFSLSHSYPTNFFFSLNSDLLSTEE
jgi:hypothetical protein